MLVTSLIGIALRSTMDIDKTISGFDLTIDETTKVINEIMSIELDDGVRFDIKQVEEIMDDMEYTGVRFNIGAYMDTVYAPIKIDISTGDAITPGAIKHEYKMLLEDDVIELWSYNLETVLAEKIQTILNRGIINTRMRDFYDVNILFSLYRDDINKDILKTAYRATCEKRETNNLLKDSDKIITDIKNSEELKSHWMNYKKKYRFAAKIEFEHTVESVEYLVGLLKK